MPYDVDEIHTTHPSHMEASQDSSADRVPLIEDRIVLEAVQMNLSGQVATAVVRLRERGRRVSSRAVGRNVEARRLALLGEAAARALTELMPVGYGAILTDIQAVATEAGEAVVAALTLLLPEKEEVLMGIARSDTGMAEAAVRAILNAVNRRLSFVFVERPLTSMN